MNRAEQWRPLMHRVNLRVAEHVGLKLSRSDAIADERLAMSAVASDKTGKSSTESKRYRLTI